MQFTKLMLISLIDKRFFMEDLYFALGGSAIMIGVSSIYEYYKCKKIFLADPDSSYSDILRRHNFFELTINFLGIPGYEVARNRYARTYENKK